MPNNFSFLLPSLRVATPNLTLLLHCFRLMLLDMNSGEKKCIFSGVSFVQWVEGSDVAVAQAGISLAVWYNIDFPEHPTVMPVKGDVIDIIRSSGRTEVVSVEGTATLNFELDEGLVEFGKELGQFLSW